MVKPETLDLIKKELARGTKKELLAQGLKEAGYSDSEIGEIIAEAEGKPASILVKQKVAKQKKAKPPIPEPVLEPMPKPIPKPIPEPRSSLPTQEMPEEAPEHSAPTVKLTPTGPAPPELPKISKKVIGVILFIIIIIVVIIGATLFFSVGGAHMIDCGTNSTCFSDATKTCTPAKAVSLIGAPGDQTGPMMYAEIRGLEGNNCVLYMKITGVSPELAAYGIIEGMDMTCRIPKEMLSGGSMPTDMGSYCSGPLFNAFFSYSSSAYTQPPTVPHTFRALQIEACNGTHLRVRSGGNTNANQDADIYLMGGPRVGRLKLTEGNEIFINEVAWRPIIFESGYTQFDIGIAYSISDIDYTTSSFTC